MQTLLLLGRANFVLMITSLLITRF